MHRFHQVLGRLAIVSAACVVAPSSHGESDTANTKLPPLPIETVGQVRTLPDQYPDTWFWAFDVAFGHMLSGKMTLIDASASTTKTQIKGMFNVSLVGSVVEAKKRNEIYAFETFYSRGNRGVRTDVVTIYSKTTLAPLAEIVWPFPKRYQGMPERYALQLIDDEKLLLAYNFTPASSVTVIDIDNRKILNEVSIPGCALIYPTGERGFSSLCNNGGMLSTELSADGKIIRQTRMAPFFDTDANPAFERPAIIDGVAYYPGFESYIHMIDMRGNVAKHLDTWDMLTEAERDENWRPGGIGIIDKDDKGQFYILMHPDGHDGTQNHGGSEVWVFDAKKRQRVGRYPLQSWGLTLGVGKGESPLLMVTTGEMALEVYDAKNGDYLRTIQDAGQETPLMIYGVK